MKDFFDPSLSNTTSFFDDAPASRVRSDAEAHSQMSSSIDAFRQGVEISSMKHFGAGIVKIHSGEPGHVLRQLNVGLNHKVDHVPFVEVDGFSYRSLPLAQELSIPTFDGIVTMPSSSITVVQNKGSVMDGVIDPLSIRNPRPMKRIDGVIAVNTVNASLQAGNVDASGASDSVETVYDTLQSTGPYVENYASSYFIENDGTQRTSTTFKSGYVETSELAAFVDARYVRNDVSDVQDNEISAMLSNMTGSTEVYVSSALSKKSSPCGWTYDTCFAGTDSITYGGRTH